MPEVRHQKSDKLPYWRGGLSKTRQLKHCVAEGEEGIRVRLDVAPGQRVGLRPSALRIHGRKAFSKTLIPGSGQSSSSALDTKTTLVGKLAKWQLLGVKLSKDFALF